jgi:hypothetical protein
MAHAANRPVQEHKKFRRALAAVWDFVQALESSSSDLTLDRIERLEREVERVKVEVRRGEAPTVADANNRAEDK